MSTSSGASFSASSSAITRCWVSMPASSAAIPMRPDKHQQKLDHTDLQLVPGRADRPLAILYRIDCRHRGKMPSSSAVSDQEGTAMATARLERRLSAILAADVVGYSRLMERDEAGTFERL